MIDTSLRWAIDALVQIAMPQWHRTRALYLGIDCRMWDNVGIPREDWDEGNRKRASGSLHLLIQKTSNYLTVWIATTDKVLPRLRDVPDFGETAIHHDSCWIDSIDSAASDMYFDLAEKTNSEKAPIDLEYKFHIHKVQMVDLNTEMIERDLVRYWVINSIDTRRYIATQPMVEGEPGWSRQEER